MLNLTLTHGPRLSVVMEPSGCAVIGNRISREKPLGEPVSLSASRAQPRLELRLLHTLALDKSQQFLTTTKNSYKLSHARDSCPIVTYDYTCNPPNSYPEAHFHLHGEAVAIREMLDRCGRTKDKPDDLHFPVGGRRFRPCLEDLIEFCILEQLVVPHDGWQKALEESRRWFHKRQLQAAVRGDPEVAADALAKAGWRVTAAGAE